jgi:hypothetical protein
MFIKFFLMCNLGYLHTLLPVLRLTVNKWKKRHRTKKNSVFLKGECCTVLYTARGFTLIMFLLVLAVCFKNVAEIAIFWSTEHTTKKNLGKKVYSVIAIAFAGRGCEVIALQFANIKLITVCEDGGQGFCVSYKRGKRNASYVEEEEFANIYGKLEVEIIDAYLDAFPAKLQAGRLFRKLKKVNGRIVGTNIVIWRATCTRFENIPSRSLNFWAKLTQRYFPQHATIKSVFSNNSNKQVCYYCYMLYNFFKS